jgi:hypothetical protein
MRAVAMLALALLLTGTFAISVNAELRERFFTWVVTRYHEYSEFGSAERINYQSLPAEEREKTDGMTEELDMEQMNRYAAAFIPEGFVLSEKQLSSRTVRRMYVDADDNAIHTGTSVSNSAGYNTEDVEEIQTIRLFGREAFMWERLGTFFVVFQLDGFRCHVIADSIGFDATLKIAESMTRYEETEQADADKPTTKRYGELAGMRPTYVPEDLVLWRSHIYSTGADYNYRDETVTEVDVLIRAAEEGIAGGSSNGEAFQWAGSGYVTAEYNGYGILIDGNAGADEAQKMAQSMMNAE